ncbi:MAG TPA: isoprenylcysteine carboxylmethyltransferase family protein [Spirochaetia bacterium]|nr:isoprenylcysteine carboxylmethyltransferase family protein [Spirochaetia bacterium]
MGEQALSRNELTRVVLTRLVTVVCLLGLIFFLPAWTFAYWNAWIYLAVLLIPMLFALRYLLKRDPQLLERRMRTREREPEQKRLVGLSLIPFLAGFILPGFDFRFGWSRVPMAVALGADLLVLLGYVIVILVFRENSYASRTVEVEEGQSVIATGPYSIVRHPMYVGAILMYCLSPIALGSYWAVIPALFIVPVLVQRIRNEEIILERDLLGYADYMKKIRYRLLPGIW